MTLVEYVVANLYSLSSAGSGGVLAAAAVLAVEYTKLSGIATTAAEVIAAASTLSVAASTSAANAISFASTSTLAAQVTTALQNISLATGTAAATVSETVAAATAATALVETTAAPTAVATVGISMGTFLTGLVLAALAIGGAVLLGRLSGEFAGSRPIKSTDKGNPALRQQQPQTNDPVLDKRFDQPMYLLYLEEHGIYDAPYKVVDKRLTLHWQQADEKNHVMIPASDGEYHYKAFNRGGPFNSLREVHSALGNVSAAEKTNASFALPK